MFIFEKHEIHCDWAEIEKKWIAIARDGGFRLTNGTDGGDGVLNPSDEARRKMSIWQIGRKLTPEHKAKLGASSRDRRHDQAWKDLMSSKMKGREITWRDKVGKANQKLTDEQVREIRRLISEKVSQYVLAAKFGVHQGTISNIKRGVSYSHVE